MPHCYYELNLSEIFGYPLRIGLSPWHVGIKWSYLDTSSQADDQDISPNLGVTLAGILNTDNHQAWLSCIPRPVLNQALVFEQHYGHGLSALSLASQDKRLNRMLGFSPFLLWHILEYGEHQRLSQYELIQLAVLPREQVLRRIGLPQPLSIERLFRHHYNPVNQIAEPIDIDLLRWLRENPEIMYSKFIEDTRHWSAAEIRQKVDELKHMGSQLQIHNITLQVQNCMSISHLNLLYERFNEKYLYFKQQRQELLGYRRELSHYPKPALGVPSSWQFIDSWQHLMEEAYLVDHQIGLYHPMILRGQYAIFKVCNPERLTIGFRVESEQVALDQIWRVRDEAARA
ncbi:hypothetical protein [Thiomicrospira microaerophila]|uniref:hypothetical protein n=1 Tax=Thiomicrospira microaerophila TaxID=406020 RepID=UPI0005CA1FCB|nr:hypothetical protein [Thiomicrospira microaerophila]